MASFFSLAIFSQSQPQQPLSGPGSARYIHGGVNFYNFSPAFDDDGYWLFEPTNPKPDSADVIVFNHGYGVYNPGPYGKWIEHLVRQGYIVIFTRYQYSESATLPSQVTDNAVTGIKDALIELTSDTNYVQPRTQHLALIGHSYGGVISANLATQYNLKGIPKPSAMLLCAPGTGGLNTGRLSSYTHMDTSIKVLSVVAEDDGVVGDTFGREIFNTTNIPKSHLNLVIQKRHLRGIDPILAGHNECLAADATYDGGTIGTVISGGYVEGATDAVNYYCYWKLADALLDCAFKDTNCDIAFGDTPAQRYMGLWSDNVPAIELDIYPKNPASITHENRMSDIQIYPNPSNGKIYFNGNKEVNEIKIFNALGKEVKVLNNIGLNSSIVIEEKGIYYMSFYDEEGVLIGTKTISILP